MDQIDKRSRTVSEVLRPILLMALLLSALGALAYVLYEQAVANDRFRAEMQAEASARRAM